MKHEFSTIVLEIDDALARITLDNPPLNALCDTMIDELERALVRVEHEGSARVLLFNAHGRFFCAGGDLSESIRDPSLVQPAIARSVARLHTLIRSIDDFPLPIVTVVQGDAAGAGMSLALLGDYVIASEGAFFKTAYVSAGITPDGGITSTLARLGGRRLAQRLFLLDEKIPASEAMALRLITEVCPAETLDDHSRDIALRFAKGPSQAIGRVKRLIRSAEMLPMSRQLDEEAKALVEAVTSEDGREGMMAFLEKRKPKFW